MEEFVKLKLLHWLHKTNCEKKLSLTSLELPREMIHLSHFLLWWDVFISANLYYHQTPPWVILAAHWRNDSTSLMISYLMMYKPITQDHHIMNRNSQITGFLLVDSSFQMCQDNNWVSVANHYNPFSFWPCLLSLLHYMSKQFFLQSLFHTRELFFV